MIYVPISHLLMWVNVQFLTRFSNVKALVALVEAFSVIVKTLLTSLPALLVTWPVFSIH